MLQDCDLEGSWFGRFCWFFSFCVCIMGAVGMVSLHSLADFCRFFCSSSWLFVTLDSRFGDFKPCVPILYQLSVPSYVSEDACMCMCNLRAFMNRVSASLMSPMGMLSPIWFFSLFPRFVFLLDFGILFYGTIPGQQYRKSLSCFTSHFFRNSHGGGTGHMVVGSSH